MYQKHQQSTQHPQALQSFYYAIKLAALHKFTKHAFQARTLQVIFDPRYSRSSFGRSCYRQQALVNSQAFNFHRNTIRY
jgi:hypothetical protein